MLRILTSCYSTLELGTKFSEVELDLGCGKGGFLLALAARYPSRLVIGADVMLGRLRKVERKANRRNLLNTLLLRVNAWDLIGYQLPDHSINRVHILCPDPWPKSRHRSKRLVSSEFLGRLSTKIAHGGLLHLSTDDTQYFSFMQSAISTLPSYERLQIYMDDISDIKTDFEIEFEKNDVSVNHCVYRINYKYI